MQLKSPLVFQLPGWDFHPQEVFQERAHGVDCKLDHKCAHPPREVRQGRLYNQKRNCEVAMGETLKIQKMGKAFLN